MIRRVLVLVPGWLIAVPSFLQHLVAQRPLEVVAAHILLTTDILEERATGHRIMASTRQYVGEFVKVPVRRGGFEPPARCLEGVGVGTLDLRVQTSTPPASSMVQLSARSPER